MRKLLFGCLIATGVGIGYFKAPSAQAASIYFVDLGGGPQPWEVTTVTSTYNQVRDDIAAGLTSNYEFPFGLFAVGQFVNAIQGGLGTPNIIPDVQLGGVRTTSPFFPVRGHFDSAFDAMFWQATHTNPGVSTPSVAMEFLGSNDVYTFGLVRRATVVIPGNPPPSAVPTPALLPGLIGFGMSALRKKRKAMQVA